MKGLLYIVSTPIGNLEDITLRALRTLKEVDIIAAEDTRHTRKLLTHYNISRPMISYWGAREKVKAEEVIEKLRDGLDVALVTDAGTPGISDPGAVVIRRALEEGFEVIPVPGPSALVAALSVSGLDTRSFVFYGFLKPKRTQRINMLQSIRHVKETLVFYEAPHRVLDTLEDILEVFGDRQCCVCHEITKMNEEFYRGTISEVINRLSEARIAGEYVLVIEGHKAEGITIDEAVDEVLNLMKQGLRRKEAVKQISGQYGISQKQLYDQSLERGER
ncbi:MAG TPA: 16S rRNA (cytidine(1402)-2'-O)-methyltransferase [Nitrospirae bacterium]|nr:16S rRNA (cytidine(1402)-2'-O)-methyltransferase [Nitrospirota bacterium]